MNELAAIGAEIARQNSRGTGIPIFAVQQQRRIYGLDPDYHDDQIVWIDGCNDHAEADAELAAELEAEYQETGKERDCFTRTGYIDIWEFVTACFTEKGCEDYIAQNGHNLENPCIYAYGGYRNREWETIRRELQTLARAEQSENAHG